MLTLIFLVAILLNYQHREALLLTLLVGLGALVPIPKEYGALVWYLICGLIEATILLSACLLTTKFSVPLIMMSLMFIVVHYLGWKFDGYLVKSPYHCVARTIEFTELMLCVVLSNPVVNYIREKIK